MAYTLPVFPILCKIYPGPYDFHLPLRVLSPCNLAQGLRVFQSSFPQEQPPGLTSSLSQLLLPPGTDVRDCFSVGGEPDVIECPAGSGRWYQVSQVDDFGKGFPNEHRFALMYKIGEILDATTYAGLFWPTPLP